MRSLPGKRQGIVRGAVAVAASLCLAFGGVPAVAAADQGAPGLAAAPSDAADGLSIDLDGKSMFVMFDDAVSSISIGNAVSALDGSGRPVVAVERYDHGVYKVEFGQEADGDGSYASISGAQAAVEDAAPRAETAPVKKYQLQGGDPDHFYQTEYLGLFEKSNSANPGNTGHGFEKVRQFAAETGATATVAVIDSGFRATHAELKGKLVGKYAYDATTGKVGVIGRDGADHGTGVASLIVANEGNGVGGYGICANTKVLPIKAANDKGELADDDILKSLQHIERVVKAGQVKDLKVVNMSFGAHYTAKEKKQLGLGNVKTDPVYKQIKRLHDKYGITCVCAGGNGVGDGYNWYETGYNFPSDYGCCIAVHGSYDDITNACYADVNKCKDISALVWGEVASAKGDYRIVSAEGTSFSSPYVAAAIVSLMQINGNLTPDSALKLLQRTAVKVPNAPYCNYSAKNGSAGVMNAEKAAWLALGKAKRGTRYWDGMSDVKKVGKLTFGFQVLSAKKKTAALTSVLGYRGTLTTLTFPGSVKLGDGTTYKVTENRVTNFNLYGKIGNIVCPANMATIGEGGLVPISCDDDSSAKLHTLSCVTLKSKNLTKASVRNCFGCRYLTVNKVVVNVSKSHAENVRYAAKYRRFLTKANCGSTIKRVVAA